MRPRDYTTHAAADRILERDRDDTRYTEPVNQMYPGLEGKQISALPAPRPLRAGDVSPVARIEAIAGSTSWTLRNIQDTLAAPTTVALVIDHPPAGHAISTVVLDQAELLTIAVSPSHRRQGYGRALLNALHEHWRAAGVEQAYLEVRDDNLPAIALYTSEGWRRTGTRPRYYRDGTDAVVLTLDMS